MIHSFNYLYISTVVCLYIVILQNKQDEVHNIYRIYHFFYSIEHHLFKQGTVAKRLLKLARRSHQLYTQFVSHSMVWFLR